MWKNWVFAVVAILVVGIVWTPIAFTDEGEEEEKATFDQLPPAVREAVKKAYPNAKILECEKETERGRTTYEVDLKVDNREVELELDASGKILEEEIASNQLPEPVIKTLRTLLPKGKVIEAERKTKDGKTVYEVDVRCRKIILELKLNKSGKLLRIKVEEEEDED